jgi:hypothetical protein
MPGPVPPPHPAVHFTTHGFNRAQPSKPAVAKMKMKTTASSLTLSRWKQGANTSSSLALAQIGSLYDRQKARLQDVQVRCELDPEEEEEEAAEEAAREKRRRREEEEEEEEDLGGLRAMMVLLLKQMHLQKDVADAVCCWWVAG